MKRINLVVTIVISMTVIAVLWQIGGTKTITVTVPRPTAVATISPTKVPVRSVVYEVPYTVQAPSGQWGDERFQDACEEVNAIMTECSRSNVQCPIKNGVIDKAFVEKEVIAIEDYEQKNFKSVVDTSAQDTAERIIKGYFGYQKAEVLPVSSSEDIVRELMAGKIVITPMNGQIINNPHYKQPGPARHMILVKGYDAEKKVFITNDSGIGSGAGYTYPEKVFFNGIRDYPSGDHEPITGVEKKMIVVSR